MLSYDYWQSRFGSNRSIVGQTIRVDGKASQVIGVMPKEFRFLDWEQPSLFLPLRLDRGKTTLGQLSYEGVAPIALRCHNVQAANADVARGCGRLCSTASSPRPDSVLISSTRRELGQNVRPLSQDVIGDVGKAALGVDGQHWSRRS